MLPLSSPSVLALLAANLVPLGGVLFFDWRIDDVLLLFWFESAVIGVFNIAKLLYIGGWSVLPVCLFFVVHYGGFMAGHLVFILAILGVENGSFFPGYDWLLGSLAGFWPAMLALLASHGYSFVDNFLRRQEYLERTVGKQMAEPYARIMVMHASILFGSFMVVRMGSPLPALVSLVVLKTCVDLFAHLREHRARGKAEAGEQKVEP